jgi:hypothetical protein
MGHTTTSGHPVKRVLGGAAWRGARPEPLQDGGVNRIGACSGGEGYRLLWSNPR